MPLSNDTTFCRTDTMGTDTVVQLVGKPGELFSLQLDKWTNVSGIAHLMVFVAHRDTDNIYIRAGRGKQILRKLVLKCSSIKTV